jgi:hypothetical protein
MINKNLIKDLENRFYVSFNNKSNEEECIKIINKIFKEIRGKDIFYNLFLIELNQNFVTYFKNLIKDLSIKKNKIDNEMNPFIKDKFLISLINKELLLKIQELLIKETEILKEKETSNKISRSELSISGGLKILKIIKLLNKEFKNNGHLELVSDYLGYESNINALAYELSSNKSNWWKHKKKTNENKTLAVHLDKEFTCMKSIIYLSDVEENNGPFTVYPKIYENLKLNIFQDILGRIIHETAVNVRNEKLKKYLNIKETEQAFASENLQKIFSNLPEITSFNSHFGWELTAGSKMEKEIIERKKEITGVAGTTITFDGSRLLHSGGLVKGSRRLALQVIYSRKINIFNKYFFKIKNKLIK